MMTKGDNDATGYILEVDMEMPLEFHEKFKYFPLAPESMTVTDDMLSPKAKEWKEKLNLGTTQVKKLIASLLDKTKYVIHYATLKLYMQLGMEVTKIHRIISFDQRDYMRSYIEKNSMYRMMATNDFEKDYYKLMNNSVFGKTMENLRKRVNIDLVNTEEKLIKLVASPSYHGYKMFDEDLIAVERKKVKLLLHRPMYIGFCILDISKGFMYSFYYNILYPKFERGMKLLFTDTDSLCIQVQTPSLAAFLDGIEDHFDTSNFPQDHPQYSSINKKVPGKMKFETAATPITHFTGIRSKMYCLKTVKQKEIKRAKGVARCVTQNELTYKEYHDCLYKERIKTNEMTRIQSDHHNLYTVKVNKVSLSPYDDKRYLLDNGIQSVPYGYCGPYPLDIEEY